MFISLFVSVTASAQINVNVTIIGLDQPLENNVRLFLSIEQQKNNALITEGRLQRLHKKAPQEISKALEPFGFYRPHIQSSITQPVTGQWQVTYTVDAGPPLPIAEFDFSLSDEMAQDSAFQAYTEHLPLKQGDVFNHLLYETLKSELAKLAAERGYFKARFSEHRIEINLQSYEARIRLKYDGGIRYRFGKVIFTQNVLNEELLQRYVGFEHGTYYTLNELIDLQQALNDSDYFQTVEVSPARPSNDNVEIPVNVELTPRKFNRYTFGLGYGTDTGARTKFGWEIPRLNNSGHRFDTEIKISEIGYSLAAHYRVPVLNPRTDQIIYSAGEVNEKTDSTESTVRTIGASLNRSHGHWRESVSLNYQQENFTIADVDGDSSLLMPAVNWSRTWSDNIIYTVDGVRINIGLRGATKDLVSDTDFTQFQTGIKAIASLNQNNRLIARASFGTTWTQEFEQLPSSVRFFTGGSQSVRGYAYQSLGPENSSGEVIGGQHLIVGSLEYEYSFNNKWGLALFYDSGNAVEQLDDKLEQGAGFGLRWKSPVGMVRIDLASAITQDGEPWRLHINIGPDL